VNLQDLDGNTALHIATLNNNIDVVKLLLENGADKEIKNKNEKTALDFAKKAWFLELKEILK